MSENKYSLPFALVLDSTIVVEKEVSDRIEIVKVPLSITIGDDSRPENEWTIPEIVAGYEDKPCHTACPSSGEFLNAYQKLFQKGYEDLVVLTMTKGVSGTYQAAMLAVEALPEERKNHVFVVDAPLANYGETALLSATADLLDKPGVTAKEYFEKLSKSAGDTSMIWTLGSLTHLYKGGRLSKLSFAVGQLLHIKPIIGIDGEKGTLQVEKKARTFEEVDKYMIERVRFFYDRFKKVYVRFINLGDEDQVANLKKKVTSLFHNIFVSEISEVGPLFTVHLGRNGYGLCVVGIDALPVPNDAPTRRWFEFFKK